MNTNYRSIGGLALLCALPMTALAQSSQPLTVSATVTSVCSVTAPSTIAFGSVTPGVPKDGQGSVVINCNKGAGVTATATSNNASGGVKRMAGTTAASTGDFLPYQVWQPDPSSQANAAACAGTRTDWTGSLSMTTLWNASGGPRTIAVCATANPTATQSTGDYSDSLIVAITVS